MKRFKMVAIKLSILIFILIIITVFSYARQEEKMISLNENIISITKSNNIIYAASENSVFISQDEGVMWQKIYHISKVNKKINKLYSHPKFTNDIYIGTQDGLYQSKNQGKDWQRIFIGSSDLENDCLSIASADDTLYLGTKQGLFISYNQGKKWIKSSDQFSESIISSIAVSPKQNNITYVASERGVFETLDNGKTWRRIYVVYGSEIPDEDYNDYDGEVSDKIVFIKDLAIPPKGIYKLYIVTKEGIFFIDSADKTERLSNFGLYAQDIRKLAVSDDGEHIFVATDRGIFKLFKDGWQKFNHGLDYDDFSDLIIDKESFMWIAGKRGVVKIKIEDVLFRENNQNGNSKHIDFDLRDLFKGEPTVEEVQKAAIEYSEVNMNKIKAWRRQSKLKALFPTISVGYDKSVYGSSSGAMAVGPRDWDIDFSWNVADLIWSTDQTSIDSRSRLTVQLRQDVLDQVTRLYFERQRLKAEILFSPPPTKRDQLNKTLQIQEITAGLDALTNGYFSQSLYPIEE